MIASAADEFNANLAPIVYRAVGAQGSNTDSDSDGIRDLNGIEYETSSDQLHIPSFIAAPNYRLVLVGLTGLGFRTIVSFLAYNDNEEAFSGQVQFDCWDIRRLETISGIFTDSFLEGTNDDTSDTGVDNYEGGWIRMDGLTAFSTAQQRSNPAFLAAIVNAGQYAALPYGVGENPNGDLLPIGPFYDNN